jgi:hypothetical protein
VDVAGIWFLDVGLGVAEINSNLERTTYKYSNVRQALLIISLRPSDSNLKWMVQNKNCRLLTF